MGGDFEIWKVKDAVRRDLMRFGLAGAGCIGRIRAKALNLTNGCELAAITDVDRDRSALLADSSNVQIYDDYHKMLTESDLDAVIVSTPPQYHEEMVV